MKRITLLLLLVTSKCFAQSIDKAEGKICNYLDRINYWDLNEVNDKNDSLSIYNNELYSFLIEFLSSHPSSIDEKFKLATSNNLHILTSKDGKFRIYNWNTQQGGTMQFFRTIFQFSKSNKVLVLPVSPIEPDDNGSFYYDLNQISINDSVLYILSSVSIGSSAVYYYQIAILTISDELKLTDYPIIKEGTKIKSEISYEIDLSNSANRNNKNARENMHLDYDKAQNIISLPFIDDSDKVTKKKIKYKFNGKYFLRK